MYSTKEFITDLRDEGKIIHRAQNTARFFVENDLLNVNQIKEKVLETKQTGAKEALVNMYKALGNTLPKDLKETGFKMNISILHENEKLHKEFLSLIAERKFILSNKVNEKSMLKPLAE